MSESHTTRLIIAARADRDLHAAVDEEVTRALVYDVALHLGMSIHPARARAMEDA